MPPIAAACVIAIVASTCPFPYRMACSAEPSTVHATCVHPAFSSVVRLVLLVALPGNADRNSRPDEPVNSRKLLPVAPNS